MEAMKEQIFNNLKAELSTDGMVNDDLLKAKIDSACIEIKSTRNYPKHYTDEMIDLDMEKFYSNIKNIALYDYNQVGIEGQSSSSENGENRTFIDRSKLFYGVIPFAK